MNKAPEARCFRRFQIVVFARAAQSLLFCSPFVIYLSLFFFLNVFFTVFVTLFFNLVTVFGG